MLAKEKVFNEVNFDIFRGKRHLNCPKSMTSAHKLSFDFTAEQVIEEARTTQEDIDVIIAWLSKEKVPQLTKEQIVLFLLSCDNNHETTKNTIKVFYELKKHSPDLFDNQKLVRDDLQNQLQNGLFCFLPKRTDDGCLIIYYGLHNTQHYDFHVWLIFKALLMTLDAALSEYPPQGLILLVDMKGVSLKHFLKLRLGHLRTIFRFLLEAIPIKLRNIHVLNAGNVVEKFMALVRPFVKKEVLDIMQFHTTNPIVESFYEKCISRKYLPEEYGGELLSLQDLHQRNIERLVELQSHFDAEEFQRRCVDS